MRWDLPEAALAEAEHATTAAIILVFPHFAINVLQHNSNGSDDGNDQRTKGNRIQMIPYKRNTITLIAKVG